MTLIPIARFFEFIHNIAHSLHVAPELVAAFGTTIAIGIIVVVAAALAD